MAEYGTMRVKSGLAEMLKGGVIMDVVNAEQAKIAEASGAVAVMALERVPADIRADGGVARMSDPVQMIDCGVTFISFQRVLGSIWLLILERATFSFSNGPEWKDTLDFYVKLMKDAGPPGASSNGFNENLALFQTGKCGMWIDATVAASFVADPKQSQVADKVGFALAPDKGLGKRGNWLWAWSLAIPAGTQKAEAAEKFVAWATSKEYSNLVAEKEGWLNAPPGTRKSLYANADYQKAASFAKMTLDSIEAADPTKPTVKPVPYVGVQFVAIPEFQGIGTAIGQQFSAALAGQISVDQALKSAQQLATREMTKAGYIK
jgi:ABC-type glycerol-3-phosphate transport system substrate-binding protein